MNTRLRATTLLAGAAGVLLGTAVLVGCGGKKEVQPLPVGAMEDYRDPVLGFHMKYPKGWILDAEAGRRARVWSAEDVGKRFLDPTGPYPDGAIFSVEPTLTTAAAEAREKILADLAASNIQLGARESLTIGGRPALRVATTANYGSGVIVYGTRHFVATDTVLFDIVAAGIGDQFALHRNIFAEAIKGFELPRVVEPGRDATLPSEAMTEFDARLFTFSYPDNFNSTNPPKGSNELVVELRGVRQDCSIRFDVFPAKGLTTAKVAEQNEAKYRVLAKGQAKVGGEQASFFSYAATRDVERRFYFVVRNDKVYRVTMDYFRPQRDDYLAAYEKVLASVKFK